MPPATHGRCRVICWSGSFIRAGSTGSIKDTRGSLPMQGGRSESRATCAEHLARFETEEYPGMARVENVHPGAFWSVVLRRSTGRSSFAGKLGRRSTAAPVHTTPCRPAPGRVARQPLRDGTLKNERRLNPGEPSACPIQETVQTMGGSTKISLLLFAGATACFLLSHGFPFQLKLVCIVDQTIQNGVGKGGIPYVLVPARYR